MCFFKPYDVMAVLEVHNNLVMVWGFFCLVGVFCYCFLGLFVWGYFICLVGFHLTDEKFCTSEQLCVYL